MPRFRIEKDIVYKHVLSQFETSCYLPVRGNLFVIANISLTIPNRCFSYLNISYNFSSFVQDISKIGYSVGSFQFTSIDFQGWTFFVLFFVCTLWHFFFDRVNFSNSMKVLIVKFMWMDNVEHFCIAIMSSTI